MWFTYSLKRSRSLAVPAWTAPMGVALFALGLRLALVWSTGFDGLYGQDPFAYFDYAAELKAALAQARWPPPFFWPIGYPALAAALSTVLPLNAAAQAISICSAALVAALVFFIVREILAGQPHSTGAAIFAGGITASAGQLLISSVCVMSDAVSLFWATLSAFGVLLFHRTRALGWMALVGFALGWAVTTRWVFALLIPVWGTTLALQAREHRQLGRITLVAVAFFALAVLPQAVLIVNASGQISAAFTGDAQVVTWDPRNAFQSDIVNADGHFEYPWSIGTFYSLPLIEPDYIAIWFTPFVLLGIWALRRSRVYLLLLLGWLGTVWGFLIGVGWENWRFPLAFFPPLTVLAGIGLHQFLQHVPARAARIAAIWLALGLLVTVGWGLADAGSFIQRQTDERGIVSWLDGQVPADATILTFGETATLEHFTPFRVIEMATETPASVEQIAQEHRDVFVLLNIENVESQWQGLAPQMNFQALDDHFVLQTLASRGAYVLYSVGGQR